MRCLFNDANLSNAYVHRFWVARYQEVCNSLRVINTRQRDDVAENFREQIGYSPHFEAMARSTNEILERLAQIETGRRVSAQDIDYCRNRFYGFATAEKSVRGEQTLISSLAFDGMDAQFRSIPLAHDPMFDWLFSPTDRLGSPGSDSDLGKWLKQGYGIALLTGEDGCGKSMLMRHMMTHDGLAGILYQWSNPRPVIVAAHFFCKDGTFLQRGLQGMLQSLLRSVLLQLPGNIDALYREHGHGQPEKLRNYPWTTEVLQRHLLAILQSHTDIKFCFFIDGLDEYDGDIRTLAAFLQKLVLANNGKLCLSTSCEETKDLFTVRLANFKLGGDNLRKDLEIYLSEELRCHPWFLGQTSRTSRDELARLAADRYQNFLWGRTAVDFLRTQYRAGQTFQDMRRCLERLQTQPSALVQQYLAAQPSSVVQSGAFFFQVARATTEPPPVLVYQFLLEEYHATSQSVQPFTSEQQAKSIQKATEGLKKRCGIFLQVRSDYRVGFAHAALLDIFGSDDIAAFLRSRAPSSHDVYLPLARAYLAYMKKTKMSWGRPTFSNTYIRATSYFKIFEEFLAIARQVDRNPRMYDLLDQWEACFEKKSERDQYQLPITDRVTASSKQHFRKPILDALLVGYLEHKLRKQPDFLDEPSNRNGDRCSSKPALSLVMKSMFSVASDRRRDHVDMLRCLLQYRANPNETYESGRATYTPWAEFVLHSVKPPNFQWSLHSNLFSLFLSNGADPNTPVWDEDRAPVLGSRQDRFVSSWVLLISSISEMLHQRQAILDDTDRRKCLEVMGELRRAKADAKSHPCRQYFNTSDSRHDMMWAEVLLKDLVGDASTTSSTTSKLKSGIAEHMLSILADSGMDLNWSWAILQSSVYRNVFQSIKARVAPDTEVLDNGPQSEMEPTKLGKRTSEDMMTDNESPSKRARSETVDESTSITMAMTMRAEAGPA